MYRFCTDKECKHCFAAKYASFAKDEVHRLRLLEYATRQSPYRAHVNQIVKAYPLPGTDYLIVLEQLLPAVSSAPTFLETVRYMSVREVKICLIQLFATLAYLHKYADGFVHMDLHLANIYMIAGFAEDLPTEVGLFRLPKTRFFPVLIDFGHSYTHSEPNAQLWGPGSEYGGCAHPKYDIYKVVALHLLPMSQGDLKDFLVDFIRYCFGGILPDKCIERGTQTIYSAGCQRLRDVSYVDVLRYRDFESFLK